MPVPSTPSTMTLPSASARSSGTRQPIGKAHADRTLAAPSWPAASTVASKFRPVRYRPAYTNSTPYSSEAVRQAAAPADQPQHGGGEQHSHKHHLHWREGPQPDLDPDEAGSPDQREQRQP